MGKTLHRTIFVLLVSITAIMTLAQSSAFTNKTLAYYQELDRFHLNNFMDFDNSRVFDVKTKVYSDYYSTSIYDSMAKYGVVFSQPVMMDAFNDYLELISSYRPLCRSDGFSIRMFVNRRNEIEFLDLGLYVDYKCKIDVPFEVLSDFYYKISQFHLFADMQLPDEIDYLFIELVSTDNSGSLTLKPRFFELLTEDRKFQPKKLYDLMLPVPNSNTLTVDSFVSIEGCNYSKARITRFACLDYVSPYDTRIFPINIWSDFERKTPEFQLEMRRDYDISSVDVGEKGIRSKIVQTDQYVVILYDLYFSQWSGIQMLLSVSVDDTVIDRLEVKVDSWNKNHEILTFKSFEIDANEDIVVYDLQPATTDSYTPTRSIGDGLTAIPVISKYRITKDGKFKLLEQWKGEATYFGLKPAFNPKEVITQIRSTRTK